MKYAFKPSHIVPASLFVVAVLYGLVPGIVKVGGWFELFFVNHCGLPFNSGMIIYFAVLITTVLAAIYATTRRCRPVTNVLCTASVALLGIPFIGKGPVMPFVIGGVILTVLFVLLFVKYKGQYIMRKQALNTSMLCMLMLMIGYSTYAVTMVRSIQDPPMNQNDPQDIFTMSFYLGREQYGESPLLYGRAFTSKGYEFNKVERVRTHDKTEEEIAAGKTIHEDGVITNYATAPEVEGMDVGLMKIDGETIAADALSAEFLAANLQFAFGQSADAPWTFDGKPILFTEPLAAGIAPIIIDTDKLLNGHNAQGVYDVQGRRLDSVSAPGLYIIGGRKTIVK